MEHLSVAQAVPSPHLWWTSHPLSFYTGKQILDFKLYSFYVRGRIFLIFEINFVCVCVRECHMNSATCRDQRRALDLSWVLGTEFKSSARKVGALTC